MRRLRWKLATSYIAVTVGTVLTLEVLLLLLLAVGFQTGTLSVTVPTEATASGSAAAGDTSVSVQLTEFQPTALTVISAIPELALWSLACLIVPTTLIGTVFGLLTAGWITRRLSRVRHVTTDWSGGRFAARIDDQARDEIGELSRTLDAMAAELETLVVARQRIAALDERNRLALDLHDGVKQQLFAATMNLGAVNLYWSSNNAEARHRLQLAEEQLHEAQRDLRDLIQALRPLSEGTPAAALRQIADTWHEHNAIAVHYDLGQAPTVLAVSTREALVRISQEALANVAKHSAATQVFLTLRANGSCIELSITDNGRGFDRQHAHTGLGLTSMHSRAAQLGGICTISSDTNGTRVAVTFTEKP